MSSIKVSLIGDNLVHNFIIYPETGSIEFALVKTCNKFSYCTESRNVLQYCTGLRRGVPDGTTFEWWGHEGSFWQPFTFSDGVEEMAK